MSAERSASRKGIPPATWELLAAAMILAWRFRLHPLPFLCRDWLTILCLFWIASVFGRSHRAWPYVQGGVMAALLILYSTGQLPLTLGALGLIR